MQRLSNYARCFLLRLPTIHGRDNSKTAVVLSIARSPSLPVDPYARKYLRLSALSSLAAQRDKPSVTYVPKPWLDRKRPTERRVQELLDATAALHPADFVDRDMMDLVKRCCQQNNLEGMQLAQDVIDRLLVEKKRLHANHALYHVVVPVNLIQKLLYGWAVQASTLRVASSRMREVLQLAIDEAKQDAIAQSTSTTTMFENDSATSAVNTPATSQPNVQLFNTYLQGLVNASKLSPQAAVNGEAMLYEMSEYNTLYGWHTKPNTRSYTYVIMAYANTHHPGSGQRAYNLFRTMQQVHNSEKESYEKEYNMSYSALDRKKNKRQIVTPDTAIYTAVMKAMVASQRCSSEQVMGLLNEAIRDESVVLDGGVFVMTIKSFANMIESERNAKIRIKIAQQCETILQRMVEYMREPPHVTDYHSVDMDDVGNHNTNDVDYDPNVHTDPTNEGDNVDLSQRLPEDLSLSKSQAQPQLLAAFNACLDTWSRAYCKEAAPRCRAILQRMITAEKNKSAPPPDTVSFNTCLYAWSRAHEFHPNAAQKAINLLLLQQELSSPDRFGNAVTPDFQSYTICILTLAESATIPDKIPHALQLLDSLIEGVAQGVISVTRNPSAPFCAVLSAIANHRQQDPAAPPVSVTCPPETDAAPSDGTHEDDDGFTREVDTTTDPYTIAKSIFSQVENDVYRLGTEVDHHIVSAYLRCIIAHCTPGSIEREHTASQVFELACSTGHVSRSVLLEFKKAVGPASTAFPEVRAKHTPKSWSRNVSAKFR